VVFRSRGRLDLAACYPQRHLDHFPLPISYKEKIRQIEGVKICLPTATGLAASILMKKISLPISLCDPKTYFELYPEFVLDLFTEENFSG